MENDKREKLLEEYHANYDEEFNDLFVVAAAGAIVTWVIHEQRPKHYEVYNQWYDSLRMAVLGQQNPWPEHLDPGDPEKKEEKFLGAFTTGQRIGRYSFQEKDSFRSFVKAIGVSGMGDRLKPEERGDLMTFLQMFLAIANEYEPPENLEKYNKDINDICIHQLEGEGILEEIQSNANILFQDVKDTLMKWNPIEGIEDSESN